MDNTFAASNINTIQPEERMFALFSHLSLFMGGLLIPLIFWLLNKDKSKFVTFHSLQALWFHIAYVGLIVVFIIVLALATVVGGVGFGAMGSGGKEMSVLLIIIMIAFYALLFLFIFGAMGYAIYMGIKSYGGSYIKYPVIGNMVYKRVYGINH
ncbi:MAG: DUF4870 domain-containing protein [Chlorobi bacterium]|nr:DUF4870 domain-containing protein [Chlorobiota bacterium]MCI0715325.1 DUF4870 domain-containing protein [Chlorobiota bacterium]